MKALKRRLLSTATVTGMVAGLLALATPAQAAPILVTNTNWSGAGSLADAITQANLTTGATINFSIGTGFQTITLDATHPLPEIHSPMTIDGTTQPSYSGTPLIEVNGANAAGVGLSLANPLGGVGGSDVIRGLVINRFQNYGIYITSSNNTIQGNYIGTNAAGTAAAGNFRGVLLWGNTGTGGWGAASNNTIGGTSAATRNVISGNTEIGILIEGGADATGNVIQGNYVGTNAAGTAAVPNDIGIAIHANNNTIGGAGTGAGNVVSGNGNAGGNGIGISAYGAATTGNTVKGNLIGTAADGTTAMGNAGMAGVLLSDSAGAATIGGVSPGEGNTIAYNGGHGIATASGGSCCVTGISIRSNSIFANSGLGIDLDSNGVTLNDTLDPDAGPNNLQNFPVLTSVSVLSGSASVTGSLNSEVNKAYRIEFFKSPACDGSGYGEGKTFLGAMDNVMTDSNGNAAVSPTNLGGPNAVAAGDYITATATDPNGNTSEFSQCRQATQAAATVPGAPTNVTAGAGDASAVVSWAPPASEGGSPITGYTVRVAGNPDLPGLNVSGSARSATVTGLTNGLTYQFEVTATNAVGSGPPATSAAVTPENNLPPATSTNKTVAAGGTVSTGTAPTSTNPTVTSVTVPSSGTVSIAESSPPTGATPPGGGTFIGQQSDITAPAATAAAPLVITLMYDTTVVNASKPLRTYRTEAGGPETLVPDCLGNTQALADGSPCVTSRTKNSTTGDWTIKINTASASRWRTGQPEGGTTEDVDKSVGYNSWAGVADAAASGGSYRRSGKAGAKVTFKTPVATSVVWVTRKASDQGKATVTIDGVAKGTFDLYSLTDQASAQVSFPNLPSKAHTIVIKVVGTKNASATGTYVVVDAFIAAGVTTQDNATKVKYDNWIGATNASASGSSYRSCTTKDAYVTFTFTGVGVDLVTAKGPGYGVAEVFLDGVSKGTLDLYSSTTQWKFVQSYGATTSGQHTIKIRVTGTKNSAASSVKVVFDALTVH